MQALPGLFAGVGTGTLTTLATVATVAGAVVSMQAAATQSQYAQDIAARNAKVAAQNAEHARNTSMVQAQDQDLEARAELGAFLAEAAASGFSVNSPSITGGYLSKQQLAAKDRGTIVYDGETRARNFENQSSEFKTEGAMAKSAGYFDRISGFLDVGSSLISGAQKYKKVKFANTVNQGA